MTSFSFSCPRTPFCVSSSTMFENESELCDHIVRSHANDDPVQFLLKCGAEACDQTFTLYEDVLKHFKLQQGDHNPNIVYILQLVVDPLGAGETIFQVIGNLSINDDLVKMEDEQPMDEEKKDEQIFAKKSAPKPKKSFDCTRCHNSYRAARTLKKHLETCGIEKPKVQKPDFICFICGHKCNCNSSLVQHIKSHSPVRPFICQNPSCGKSYKRKEALQRHLSRSPCKAFPQIINLSSSKPFKCPDCPVKFFSAEGLERHQAKARCQLLAQKRKERAALKRGIYSCEFCDKRYNSFQPLQRHKNFKHSSMMLSGLLTDAVAMDIMEPEPEPSIEMSDNSLSSFLESFDYSC